MKTIPAFTLFTLVIVFQVGCSHLNDTTQSQRVAILNSIASKIEPAKCPVVLSNQESERFLSSLKKADKKFFEQDELSPEIKAYWYESTRGYNKEIISFIRFSNDKTWYKEIDYYLNGNTFSTAGGQVDTDWIRKWLNGCTKQ
jgi:hypothetical protein